MTEAKDVEGRKTHSFMIMETEYDTGSQGQKAEDRKKDEMTVYYINKL